MIDLLSIGALRLSDERVAYACFAVDGVDPRTLPGQTIRLDGREVLVDGVETFPPRTDFTVWVREPRRKMSKEYAIHHGRDTQAS
jgi:hypothetical protein